MPNIDQIWLYKFKFNKYNEFNPIVTELFIRDRKLDMLLLLRNLILLCRSL